MAEICQKELVVDKWQFYIIRTWNFGICIMTAKILVLYSFKEILIYLNLSFPKAMLEENLKLIIRWLFFIFVMIVVI